MAIEQLSSSEVLYGSLSFTFVIISLIIGIIILLKYFKYKYQALVTTSLTWILMTSGWWRITINFPLVILFDTEVPHTFGRIIDSVFIPVAIMCWMYTFSTLCYPQYRKHLLSVYLIVCIVYEIILIYLIFTNPESIIIIISPFNSKYTMIPYIFSIFAILTFLVTGALFTRLSLKSEDPKIRLKGKFLLIAFILFTIGAIFDAGVMMDVFTLILVRIILIASAFSYYLGFLLPEKIANAFIKE